MTDLELNKALALAIGWKPEQMIVIRERLFIKGIFLFDYRDWNVIGPIAEMYNAFPEVDRAGWWSSDVWQTEADTPQKAIAMAVIGGVK